MTVESPLSKNITSQTGSTWRIFYENTCGKMIGIFRAIQSFFCCYPSKMQNPTSLTNQLSTLAKATTDVIYTDYLRDTEEPVLPKSGTFEKLAIPIVINGCFRNHVVMIFVDNTQKTIDYYDPKGLTVNDRGDCKLVSGGTLKGLITEIEKAYVKEGEGWHFRSNTRRDQSDFFNCGVYVSNFAGHMFERSDRDEKRTALSFKHACTLGSEMHKKTIQPSITCDDNCAFPPEEKKLET